MVWKWLGGLALLGLLSHGSIAQAEICEADLDARVEAILAEEPALQRSRLGIRVETLGDRRLVYGRDDQHFFVPASNMKLFTTAAALQALGPDFRMRTVVQGTTSEFGLTTLRVVGQGDPSFNDRQLADLAEQLKRQGIQQVSELIGDDTYFSGSAVNQNWEWEDVQAGYGAPVNSLILNRNEIGMTFYPQAAGQPVRLEWDDPAIAGDWQVVNNSTTLASGEPGYVYVGRDLSRPILYVRGSLVAGGSSDTAAIAIPDPANYFLQRFQLELAEVGISVNRTSVSPQPNVSPLPELAAVDSPALAQLMEAINRDSENIYAEAVLKTLGVHQAQTRPREASQSGTAAVKRILQDMGVDPESYVQVDGSGLSRHNLATPTALVSVLQAMDQTPNAAVYRNSLSQAGINGTLRNSFRNSAIVEQLWGKSGWLSRNAALSGYVNPPNYPPLVFSILLNNADTRSSVIGRAMDDVVLLLADLHVCGD
ncbi:MAG: D-alanyl-D-alanine carboxypeptidase/D-alanyl-D-alanine-endopeptidase [Cyanobacteria bacterium P01_A01_bin.123]